jgi:hypothetical protein
MYLFYNMHIYANLWENFTLTNSCIWWCKELFNWYVEDLTGLYLLNAHLITSHLGWKIKSARPFWYVIKNHLKDIFSEIINNSLLITDSEYVVPDTLETCRILNEIIDRIEAVRSLSREFQTLNPNLNVSEDDLAALYPWDTLLLDNYEDVFNLFTSALRKKYIQAQPVDEALWKKWFNILSAIRSYLSKV